ASQVVFKGAVRIKRITGAQVEAREIICQLCWQFGILGEEARERSVFDRAYCLRVKSVFSKRRNVPVTKDLDVRSWTGVAQRLKGWQSENEIADRAAADDQNAIHTDGYSSEIGRA